VKTTINQRIKILRTELDLSQAQFVEPVGISQAALSQIEKGGGSVSYETIENISIAYNVNLNWFILGKGKTHTYSMPDEHTQSAHLLTHLNENEPPKYGEDKTDTTQQIKAVTAILTEKEKFIKYLQDRIAFLESSQNTETINKIKALQDIIFRHEEKLTKRIETIEKALSIKVSKD
jgi:transcriptional regulator with XRE-family HTH domain